MESALIDIDACVFDAYGTLLDFNTAAGQAGDILGDRAAPLSAMWRSKQLEYTWLRSLMGAYGPFSQVTSDALDFAMESLGISDDVLRTRLMQLYEQLAPFPDAAITLRALRTDGFKTAILTNGSREMINAACQHGGLTELLDLILSADEVGIFKPHPSVYQLAVDRLGVPRERIAFVSSNGWDAAGAAQFGFRVAWCNRYGQHTEKLPGRPQVTIKSLIELPDLLRGSGAPQGRGVPGG